MLVEVVFQGGDQVRGEGDVAASGGAFGGGDDVLAVDAGDRAVDVDDSAVKVEVFPA